MPMDTARTPSVANVPNAITLAGYGASLAWLGGGLGGWP